MSEIHKSHIISAKARARLDMRNRGVRALQDYIDWVSKRPAPQYVFRGQAGSWPLVPTIGRDPKRYKAERERQLFSEFKRNSLPHLGGVIVKSDWEWLAIAQHYGLPTRLLDWTTNAMVAAFFACGSSFKDPTDGEVIAVRPTKYSVLNIEGKEPGPFDLTEVGFIYTPVLASRIASQRGLFSVHPFPTKQFESESSDDRFSFPPDLKLDIRRLLHQLGVDEHFLLGGLDGLSATLRWRLEIGMPLG